MSHDWVIFPSSLRHFHPSSTGKRCSSVSLTGTTVQGFSGCDKAKSSIHSGEVSGDEPTHLDEEVANANCINCGGFRLSAQRCYDRSATKMLHVHPCPCLQLCLQPCALLRRHHICIASTFAAITPLSKEW